MGTWKLLSSHGAALVYVGKHPHALPADIVQAIGIRERNVVRVINDLVAEGYLEKELVEGKNRYYVNSEMALRRPMMANVTVEDLLKALTPLVEDNQ